MERPSSFQHELFGSVEISPGDAARKNFETLEKHMRAESIGDLKLTMETMTSNPFWIDYGVGVELHGYDAVSQRYAKRFAERPGLTVDIRRTIVTESVAVLQVFWKGFGTSAGEVPMLCWMEFKDGKLAGERGYSNPSAARR